MGVPCLALRDNTERPMTVTEGTNWVVGRDPAAVVLAAHEALDHPPPAAAVGRSSRRAHRRRPAGPGPSRRSATSYGRRDLTPAGSISMRCPLVTVAC